MNSCLIVAMGFLCWFLCYYRSDWLFWHLLKVIIWIHQKPFLFLPLRFDAFYCFNSVNYFVKWGIELSKKWHNQFNLLDFHYTGLFVGYYIHISMTNQVEFTKFHKRWSKNWWCLISFVRVIIRHASIRAILY